MSDRDWFQHVSRPDKLQIDGNQSKIWSAIVGGLGLLVALGGSSSFGGLLMLVGAVLYLRGLYLRALIR
jgi:hypothetical protein